MGIVPRVEFQPVSYEKPFWLNDRVEPIALDPEEEDAIMRRAARNVFLPKRIRALEQKSSESEDKKNHPRGFDGLKQKKQHLNLDAFDLTARQREVASLRLEYSLPKVEIARRLGIHRTTVDEHLKAASRRMDTQSHNWRRETRKRATHLD